MCNVKNGTDNTSKLQITATGSNTYTTGATVTIATPFANMGRHHIITAAPTLALASSDNFHNVLILHHCCPTIAT